MSPCCEGKPACDKGIYTCCEGMYGIHCTACTSAARHRRGSADEVPRQNAARAGKGKGDEGLTMKERTKNKRKLDQSASFLGGRWKTEEEMHMRDNFDS